MSRLDPIPERPRRMGRWARALATVVSGVVVGASGAALAADADVLHTMSGVVGRSPVVDQSAEAPNALEPGAVAVGDDDINDDDIHDDDTDADDADTVGQCDRLLEEVLRREHEGILGEGDVDEEVELTDEEYERMIVPVTPFFREVRSADGAFESAEGFERFGRSLELESLDNTDLVASLDRCFEAGAILELHDNDDDTDDQADADDDEDLEEEDDLDDDVDDSNTDDGDADENDNDE